MGAVRSQADLHPGIDGFRQVARRAFPRTLHAAPPPIQAPGLEGFESDLPVKEQLKIGIAQVRAGLHEQFHVLGFEQIGDRKGAVPFVGRSARTHTLSRGPTASFRSIAS